MSLKPSKVYFLQLSDCCVLQRHGTQKYFFQVSLVQRMKFTLPQPYNEGLVIGTLCHGSFVLAMSKATKNIPQIFQHGEELGEDQGVGHCCSMLYSYIKCCHFITNI